MKFKNFSFVLILSFLCLQRVFASPQDTITFAAFYNYSGAQSNLDIFSSNGAKLAEESINKSGGILGKKLKIIYLDGQSDTHVLAQLAQFISKDPQITITFGLTDTDMALSILPALGTGNKIYFSSGATSPNIPLLYPKMAFLSCFSDEKQGRAAAQFAFYNLHLRKSLILEQNNYAYAKALSQYYQDSWSYLSNNKKSLQKILVSTAFTEKRLIENSINTDKPDHIFIAGSPNFIIQSVNFIRSLNYQKPILGGDAFDLETKALTKGGNIYYTTHSFVSKENPDPVVQIFIKQYTQKFKQPPDSSFAALGFDTVYLLAHAVTLAQSTNREKIIEAIHKIQNYHLITGNISFLEKSNIPEKSLTIIHLENGQKSIAATVE